MFRDTCTTLLSALHYITPAAMYNRLLKKKGYNYFDNVFSEGVVFIELSELICS